MLRFLAWCGVRWAARRLERRLFAKKYRDYYYLGADGNWHHTYLERR
jgi:hypothetical protein